MKPLTKKQTLVLAFILKFNAENQKMPTTREIQAHFGLASQTSGVKYLQELEARGRIRRQKYEWRAIEVL